jgi:predicted DNA-binding transcriptional regulator AlpA
MRLIYFSQLAQEKGIRWSRVHISRLEKSGRFPARVRVGGNTIGWVEDEIDAFLRRSIEARDPS